MLGSRRIRVLVVSANAFTRSYPVIVLVHDRADGDVPGVLLPLPGDLAGGGTSTCLGFDSLIRQRSVIDMGASLQPSLRRSTTACADCSACKSSRRTRALARV
jgi:hypothetical protein